ncbi:MAG: glycoside hydrolase family 9 protein [Haloarculaceae archaeon]
MAEDSDSRVSRRAYLAASVVAASALAGCPGRSGSGTATTDAPGTEASGGTTGTGTETGTRRGGEAVSRSPAPTPTEDPTDTRTEGTDEPTETTAAAGDDGAAVVVDQVGYRPGDEKAAMVRGAAGSFTVREAGSDAVVASGELSEPTADDASGDTVRKARFGEVRDAGEYVVAVDDGRVTSPPFRVGGGVWGRTLAEVCRRFTLRRANTPIEDPVTGLDLEPGHPQDRRAKLYFDGEFHERGAELDVRGGWYDAGDYGKYVPPAAVTVAQLLLAYERNPDTFAVGQLAMPDGVSEAERDAGLPDLLAEAKFELEWLARMQRPDGAVYHKVAGKQWPGFVRPAADTQPRYVFGLSTYGTAMVAGVMAMAARVYREFDGGFADSLLSNAEAAFGYLQNNLDPYFRSDEGQNSGSGAYRKDGDAPERLWAGAELLKTTGEDRYREYVHREVGDRLTGPVHHASWANAGLLGQWAYYTAGAGADSEQSAVADALTAAADDVVATVDAQGYNVALTADDYYWGSNSIALGRGLLLLLADGVESNATYRARARDQVHYVLGRTPTTRSYVTGSGEKAPQNPHSRLVESTGINVPGNVVGGANAEGGDPELDELVRTENPPPAKCYLDVTGSYASNEPALDYAAPLVPLLAAFTPADAVSPT